MNGKKIRKAVAATALAAAGVLLLFFAVSRIAEFRPSAVETTVFDTAAPDPLPDTITLLSWNIGYAGLGDDMDFFYDGGRKVRGERRRTEKNLMEIIAALQSAGADIILLQEVDRGSAAATGSTRRPASKRGCRATRPLSPPISKRGGYPFRSAARWAEYTAVCSRSRAGARCRAAG